MQKSVPYIQINRSMKIIFYTLILLTTALTAQAKAISKPLAATDSVTRIKHPTQAMTDAEVNSILNLMQHKTSDAEKVAVLKAGVKDKGIMIAQLTILLSQFLTDDSKLTCAEFAYGYTVDYKKYVQLTSIFSSEKPKMDLEDYIHQHK